MDNLPGAVHPYRHSVEDDGPPAKRFKPSIEDPGSYSDAVRRKLSQTSRTGQACDRCKERKMKCDVTPTGCQPCRQKLLPCLTTDRVTGKSTERGHSDRAESELQSLRQQVAAYKNRFGPLNTPDFKHEVNSPSLADRALGDRNTASKMLMTEKLSTKSQDKVDAVYTGPVNGTVIDMIGERIDIGAYKCEDMETYDRNIVGVFNSSETSILNSMYRNQAVQDPELPSMEEALTHITYYFNHMWKYVPIVHKATFLDLVHKFYGNHHSVTRAEEVQIVMVLANIADQLAVRNHMQGGKSVRETNRARAFRWLHYSLYFYQDLLHDKSLASMQAMALILLYIRGLPKPGCSWNIANKVLVQAVDLNYHRNPDRIQLPEKEDNLLAKELRKRVFWIILTFANTIGARLGKPAPFPFQHLDVPFPEALMDEELSSSGISPVRSGRCDYSVMLHLCRLLPLLNELHDEVISVRRPAQEYLNAVTMLNDKILRWQEDWTKYVTDEGSLPEPSVTTWLVESWTAEYQLLLHHPTLDTSGSTEHRENCMNICLSASRQLTGNFLKMVKQYNGFDVTWHSIVSYALGFSFTLHYYDQIQSSMTEDGLKEMKDEMKTWVYLLHAADVTLNTNNHLWHLFKERVKSLQSDCEKLVRENALTNGHQNLSAGDAGVQSAIITDKATTSTGSHILPHHQHRSDQYPTPDASSHTHVQVLYPQNFVPYPHPPLIPEQVGYVPYQPSTATAPQPDSYTSYNVAPPQPSTAFTNQMNMHSTTQVSGPTLLEQQQQQLSQRTYTAYSGASSLPVSTYPTNAAYHASVNQRQQGQQRHPTENELMSALDPDGTTASMQIPYWPLGYYTPVNPNVI